MICYIPWLFEKNRFGSFMMPNSTYRRANSQKEGAQDGLNTPCSICAKLRLVGILFCSLYIKLCFTP